MTGILLALQFFTSIPVRRELPMDRRHITIMYGALPWIGALIGLVLAGVHAASSFAGFSPLLTAVLLLAAGIILTGGLHLDGVADTSDAYFSYRDQQHRHEILADPRIGAFGVLGLLTVVLLKFALLYEWALTQPSAWYWLAVIPFLARGTMTLYFVSVPSAKESGIAHFFLSKISSGPLIGWTAGCLVAVVVLLGFLLKTTVLPLGLLTVIGLAIWLYRSWTVRQFGGVTGDLSGAFIEGMEVLLWLTVLSLS
ncbi:adenosylcobinamide-GDP ribazoletransferase [Sporosarcina sp. NCCP-2716]|uniref:adenosylcobinamide-GDP ribazoletransferase n=1 Tax=Sporosarcina sp. NCCP-2716 TaxID=2943679 RepID=UPI00203CD250|nr:adenosylcobinamide-GDP ribazoletransferase [Sporosarcina sp. NCCP-2716]GKV69117.1 adenosylcobinamide-GDP ribazoletransferase [Sporosarcina sp. NCCP-2716]